MRLQTVPSVVCLILASCVPGASEEPSAAQAQRLEAGWEDCSEEWQRCSFTGSRNVRYGANGVYQPIKSFTGGVDCKNDNFGGDPLPGVTKRCSLEVAGGAPPPPPPSEGGAWTVCAQEWGRCSFTGAREVRYGANGIYRPLMTFTDGVDCRNSSFGDVDPLPNVTKQCEIRGTGTAPPPVVTPPPSNPGNGLVGYSTANPILYSNDHPEDVHTDVIMMALASNGAINLRGMVTDQEATPPPGCSGDGCHTIAIDDAHRRAWITAARQSGFRNIPDSQSGEAAVSLIVAEARAASATLPLVIMASGPLSLIARAYQRDPSITSKVIVSLAGFVAGSNNSRYYGETNVTNDLAAAQTVLERFRCVIIPFQDFNANHIDETRYPSTPLSRVNALPNEPLRARMQSIYVYPWAHYDADGGPQATLLSTGYATGSKRVRWATDAGGAYLADDASSDDVLITSVNASVVTEPWWQHVTAAFAR
jgi:hypothetical protein